MNGTQLALPSSLDTASLLHRLGELAGRERGIQTDFLLHLDELDRRGAWRDAGFGSLWDYCLRALHLREGAAGRRIGAMRVLRRFPRLEPALRDGRLCISTVTVLGQVLSEANLEDLVARAAFKTKAEVEHLVVSLQPRAAPKEGIRRLPEREAPPAPVAASNDPISPEPPAAPAASPAMAPLPAARPEVRPVAAETYSLRVTIDAGLKDDLETLKSLLGHKFPDGDLATVLREAIRCGIEKHGKRRGAVTPARKQSGPAARVSSTNPRAVPAELRRQVWQRDGGQCTWRGPDGRRCTSRERLELDHIVPVALGGGSTLDNLRLTCRAHNLLHAEQVFGRAHMAQFRQARPAQPRQGELAIAGDSAASGAVA